MTQDELRAIERPIKRDFSRVGFGVAALFCVWISAYIIITSVAALLAPQITNSAYFSFAVNIISLYLIAVPVFLIIIRKVRPRKIPTATLGFGTWLVIFIICMALSLVGALISNYIMMFFDTLVQGQSTNVVEEALSSTPLIWSVINTVIVAPIGEELIFRKALCDRLSRYGEACAVLISALMFAGFHGNLFQFVYAFLLGLVFAHVYLKTGNIRYTVYLHMAVNFMGGILPTLVMDYVGSDFLANLQTNDTDFILGHLPQIAVMLVYSLFVYGIMITGIILLIVFRKRITFNQTEIMIPRSRVPSVMVANAGMITFIVIISLYILYTLFVNALL